MEAIVNEMHSDCFEQPSQISFAHQTQYTTLNDIVYNVEDDDQNNPNLQQGQMDSTKLNIFNPLYKQIIPSKNDDFYLKFFNSLQCLYGDQKTRYEIMKKRFQKFFIHNTGIQRGQRFSRRIEANYSHSQTFPLCYAVMLYGVDYLSNKDIKMTLKLPKACKSIKRINWSNAAVIFQSKAELQESLKAIIFDNQTASFFKPKQEQDLQNFLPTKLPRGWYGMKPYEHADQYIFWFVRYLTSIEIDQLQKMRQITEFMETYNYSKKIFEKKKKERNDYDSVMNTSRYQTIDRSQKQRSINMGSEPQRRQRSRQKHKKQVVSENYAQSDILSEIESNSQKPQSQHPDLNQSYVEPMSFIYTPNINQQIDAELKKKSDQIIMMMETLHVGPEGTTLDNPKSGDLFDLDDDMAIVSDMFDPKGVNDRLIFDKRNRISELTTLKPDEKFKYSDYVEKIMEAEEEIKERKAIQVINVD